MIHAKTPRHPPKGRAKKDQCVSRKDIDSHVGDRQEKRTFILSIHDLHALLRFSALSILTIRNRERVFGFEHPSHRFENLGALGTR